MDLDLLPHFLEGQGSMQYSLLLIKNTFCSSSNSVYSVASVDLEIS